MNKYELKAFPWLIAGFIVGMVGALLLYDGFNYPHERFDGQMILGGILVLLGILIFRQFYVRSDSNYYDH